MYRLQRCHLLPAQLLDTCYIVSVNTGYIFTNLCSSVTIAGAFLIYACSSRTIGGILPVYKLQKIYAVCTHMVNKTEVGNFDEDTIGLCFLLPCLSHGAAESRNGNRPMCDSGRASLRNSKSNDNT